MTTILRRCVLVLSVAFFLMAGNFAMAYSQTIPVSKALKTVTRTFGTRFVYEKSLLRGKETTYNLNNLKEKQLEDVLKGILYPEGLVFLYVKENYYTIVPKEQVRKAIPSRTVQSPAGSAGNDRVPVQAGNREGSAVQKSFSGETTVDTSHISGRVTDDKGNGLFGVTVGIKDALMGAVTNAEGLFTLSNVPDNAKVMVFSMVGYQSKEIQINRNTRFYDVVLTKQASALGEVVVVGYGTSKIKDITGSIAHVGTKEIDNAPMGSTVQSLLQGKAAGVNVAIQSASPTSPISVIIRGASSLSGDNQPLWVIDGVPQYVPGTSGDITNTLYNLNLNDVQSIDILKDASATAIYGSRAANGVVIVTTKRGEEDMKPTIELSTRLGLQVQDFNGYKYMQAPEYKRFADAAARMEVFSKGAFDYFTRLYLDEQAFMNLNTSEFDTSDLKILPGAYYPGNTNWLKEMTHNPLAQQYDLSLRGGTHSISYYVSFNHSDMEGIVKTGRSKLDGGRLNLEAKLSKGLKFGINLSGSSRNTDDKDYMLDVLKKIRPDIPPFNEDGTIFTKDQYTENPYTTLKNTQHGSGQIFSGTGFLDWTIIEGLMLRTTYTTNYANTQYLEYKRRGSEFNTDGSRSWDNHKNTGMIWENTLTYARTFGKHDILALAGYSMERHNSLSYSMNASNFPDDDILNDFSSGATRGALGEDFTENSLVSEFARVHYKYNNRYIISGTLRRDGSSRFGPDKRWGLFPSGALAWLITEEDFMKRGDLSRYVTYLKLRASTGLAGSQNLGNYDWRTGIGSSRYNENPAIAPNSMGNPALQWEQTKMTDIGLDYGFWDDRIRGTIGVYQKKSSDLIYSSPLPPSSAFSNITSNVASTKSNGVEFDIRVDVLKKTNLTLTLDLNAAKNSTTVTKINGIDKVLYFPSSYYNYMKMEEGGKTDRWWGYQTYDRLFVTQEELIALETRTASGGKEPYRDVYGGESVGDLYFKDTNGDGVINKDDQVYLGSANPKVFGGFGASLYYKNLMINATFTYSYGNKRLWQMPMDDVGYVGNYNQSNKIAGKSATLLSPYEATIPRMTQYGFGDNGDFSDFWLYDASYVRLNALNISYRLPQRLFGNMLIQGIDITFQASNLLTLTSYPGFDPQGNWSSSSIGTGMGIDNSFYPAAKNFNLGFKFTFK